MITYSDGDYRVAEARGVEMHYFIHHNDKEVVLTGAALANPEVDSRKFPTTFATDAEIEVAWTCVAAPSGYTKVIRYWASMHRHDPEVYGWHEGEKYCGESSLAEAYRRLRQSRSYF